VGSVKEIKCCNGERSAAGVDHLDIVWYCVLYVLVLWLLSSVVWCLFHFVCLFAVPKDV